MRRGRNRGIVRPPTDDTGRRGQNEGRNPLSDTTDVTSDVPGTPDASSGNRRRRTGGGLNGMLLGELQTMASTLGISGTAKMRKGDLIAAIEQSQADSRVPRARAEAPARGQVAARGES